MTMTGSGIARSVTTSMLPRVRQGVEQLVGDLLDVRPDELDDARREGLVDQVAHAGVGRRVEAEHGRRAPDRPGRLAVVLHLLDEEVGGALCGPRRSGRGRAGRPGRRRSG